VTRNGAKNRSSIPTLDRNIDSLTEECCRPLVTRHTRNASHYVCNETQLCHQTECLQSPRYPKSPLLSAQICLIGYCEGLIVSIMIIIIIYINLPVTVLLTHIQRKSTLQILRESVVMVVCLPSIGSDWRVCASSLIVQLVLKQVLCCVSSAFNLCAALHQTGV